LSIADRDKHSEDAPEDDDPTIHEIDCEAERGPKAADSGHTAEKLEAETAGDGASEARVREPEIGIVNHGS
jgi:hypothetical protein